MTKPAVTLLDLPGGVRVGQRDWLSANHIFLAGETGNIIIDTGYLAFAETTMAYVEAAFGARTLDLIVNTHCHSDHMGCNAVLERWTHAPIAIPIGERAAIEAWDERALWLDYADQQCERFAPKVFLTPDTVYRWGDLDWQAISAPGHDDGTLMFYNPLYKILISADALWENGFGFVLPRAWDAGALSRTRAALDTIAKLDIALVIPGHGAPFSNVARALDNAYARLAALEGDDVRIARQIAKVMFIYAVLGRGGMAIAEMPRYVSALPCLRDLNAQFLKLDNAALVQWIVEQSLASGNLVQRDGWLRGP